MWNASLCRWVGWGLLVGLCVMYVTFVTKQNKETVTFASPTIRLQNGTRRDFALLEFDLKTEKEHERRRDQLRKICQEYQKETTKHAMKPNIVEKFIYLNMEHEVI